MSIPQTHEMTQHRTTLLARHETVGQDAHTAERQARVRGLNGRPIDAERSRVSQERADRADELQRGLNRLGIPVDLHTELMAYVVAGIRPKLFLVTVLHNNLGGAMSEAYGGYWGSMPDLMTLLWNYAPSPCFGSPEKVTAWMAARAAEREAGS